FLRIAQYRRKAFQSFRSDLLKRLRAVHPLHHPGFHSRRLRKLRHECSRPPQEYLRRKARTFKRRLREDNMERSIRHGNTGNQDSDKVVTNMVGVQFDKDWLTRLQLDWLAPR